VILLDEREFLMAIVPPYAYLVVPIANSFVANRWRVREWEKADRGRDVKR
jgi:hypothetical protein